MHPNMSWLLREKANDAEVVSTVVSGGSLSPIMLQQVSLSASKDGERARETHLGGALRCVCFFHLFSSYMI